MRALLLIDVIFVVLAGPISAWQKICGEQLVETVSVVCSTRGFYSHRVEKREAELFQDERTAKSFLGSRIGSRQRRRTGRIATECCEKICSYDIVESYCNPWPEVEDRNVDPILLAPVAAAGRVRQDKSADADELLLMQAAAASERLGEENSVLKEEEKLMDTLEKLDEYAKGEQMVLHEPEEVGDVKEIPEPDTERQDLEEDFPFPEVIPTKKRRRLEGRRSRENSRDRSGKSEGRSRKKSGSREGGDRSSRRRGKSSRRKKGRDGRERSKRWEGLVTSHPPTKDIVDALRSALRVASRTPSLFAPSNSFGFDEQRSPPATPTGLQQRSAMDLASSQPARRYRVTTKDNQSALEALYNLALRLSRPRRG